MFTEFNYFSPRLINQFEAESTANNAPEYIEFVHQWQQRVDLADAIEHAEKELIPALKNAIQDGFKTFSPTLASIHLNILHGYAGRTMAEELHLQAGQYAPATILRWEKSVQMYEDLRIALLENTDMSLVFKKYQLEHICADFFSIVEKISADPSIEEVENLRAVYSGVVADTPEIMKLQQFDRQIRKLVDAHHAGKLTPEQENIIRQVFKIATKPELIATKTQNFFNELVNKLKHCNGSLESVAAIASFVYFNITDIHPYFNGNGRTAALYMNSIIAAFGYPTIIFRSLKDKKDPNSLYNQAIRAIDTQPELLTQHIIHKMHEAIQATTDDRWTLSKKEESVWQQNLALIEFSESILKEIDNGTTEEMLCIMWPFIKQQAEAKISEIEENMAATTANTITTQFDNAAQMATQPPINTTDTRRKLSKN